MTRRIIIVVGEPSGDRLGAQLVTELKKLHPDIEVEGVFGREMIGAGCLQLHTMDTLTVMGLVEPLLSLHKILALRKWLINYILKDPPDLYIGIDAPDFNLGIEKVLRKAGIQTAHYVSPTVWAWRQGRIKTIKEAVDLMLTLFPFEKVFYEKHSVPVCYTGHPTADLVPFVIDRKAGKEALGFSVNDQVVAVLPGSRNSELKHMTEMYLETIKICAAAKPELKFVMPLLHPAYEDYVEYLKKQIAPEVDIKYVIADSHAVMRAADFALVTSGTATLELMLHKVPMIVAYKTDWFSYQIVKRMVKVKYISLPNLLADAPLLKEYIQNDATPNDLAAGLLNLINDVKLQYQQIEEFNRLHKLLEQDASLTAAKAVANLMY